MRAIIATIALSMALLTAHGTNAEAQVIIGPQDGGMGGIVIGPPVIHAPAPKIQPYQERYGNGRPGSHRGPGRNEFRELSDRDAVRIARSQGLIDVDDVVRTLSNYRVEGTDENGDDMEVVLDRRSGRILSVR